MANGNELIPPDLLHEVEEAARTQNREPAELVTEAVRKYLQDLSWVQFVARNEAKATEAGIGEGDVERLVIEARRERQR